MFPRLPMAAARARIGQLEGKTLDELGAMASASSAEAIYPATGGTRFPTARLENLRIELLTCARELGFPSRVGSDPVRFDFIAAPVLLKGLSMRPGEACRTDVWSFVTLQLLPDIAVWRFPGVSERRLLGGVRNTFQRLWWRAYLLHDPQDTDPWRLLRLPEDALVGLFERPAISSNPQVTRAIAKCVKVIVDTVPTSSRENAWRLAYKRIRQRMPLVNLEALEPEELDRQLRAICRSVMNQVPEQDPVATVAKSEV